MAFVQLVSETVLRPQRRAVHERFPEYALEGSCFVLAPVAITSKEIVDRLADTPERADLIEVGGGGSCIFGPDGATIAGPGPWDEEVILYANVDLYDIARAKNFADPTGHYSRPDVLSLLWNRAPQACVREGSPERPMDASARTDFDMPDSPKQAPHGVERRAEPLYLSFAARGSPGRSGRREHVHRRLYLFLQDEWTHLDLNTVWLLLALEQRSPTRANRPRQG